LCEPPAKGFDVDEVREDLLAVDLDDGNQLAVAALELRVAGDVDLLELESELVAQGVERLAGALAQVAARRPVEDNLRDRAREW
jgi:hypothetical protein